MAGHASPNNRRPYIIIWQVMQVLQTSPTSANVTLRANATAAFVSVESWSVVGAFSDGAFNMLPARDVTVRFVAKEAFESGSFTKGLKARSLRDTY